MNYLMLWSSSPWMDELYTFLKLIPLQKLGNEGWDKISDLWCCITVAFVSANGDSTMELDTTQEAETPKKKKKKAKKEGRCLYSV